MKGHGDWEIVSLDAISLWHFIGIHATFDIGNDNLFDYCGPIPLEWPLEWSVLCDSIGNA